MTGGNDLTRSRGGLAIMGNEGRRPAGRIVAALLLSVLLSASACSPQVPGSFLRNVPASTPAVVATASPPPTATGTALPPTVTAGPTTTATSAPATASSTAPTAKPATSPAATLPAFSPERARESVEYLARQIGSRPGGSPAATRAAQYIRDRLVAVGYPATLQPYTLTVDSRIKARPGSNVVASAAESSNRPTIIVGAHYDSVSAGPGANDNASGVATVIELARVTHGRTYPFDLEFVAFGDEEVGLVGSKKYVEALTPAHKGRILAMIDLDMVGVGDSMEFAGESSLVDSSVLIASRMGYQASELMLRSGLSSDNASFSAAGIPAVFFYRSADPNYHTKLDTADKVQPENLEATGKVALALLDQLRVTR